MHECQSASWQGGGFPNRREMPRAAICSCCRVDLNTSDLLLKMRVDQASALAWVAVAIAYWCIPSIKGMSGGRNQNARFSQPKNSTLVQPRKGCVTTIPCFCKLTKLAEKGGGNFHSRDDRCGRGLAVTRRRYAGGGLWHESERADSGFVV
jgi:hypothetical protein